MFSFLFSSLCHIFRFLYFCLFFLQLFYSHYIHFSLFHDFCFSFFFPFLPFRIFFILSFNSVLILHYFPPSRSVSSLFLSLCSFYFLSFFLSPLLLSPLIYFLIFFVSSNSLFTSLLHIASSLSFSFLFSF